MAIDIKETLSKLSNIEKMQAQVELRSNQIVEEETKLNEKLKSYGIKPEELDLRIKQLEASIQSKLTLIKSLDKGNEESL